MGFDPAAIWIDHERGVDRYNLGVIPVHRCSGVNDLSTFNRRFRRVIGLDPGPYRRSRSRN